MHRGGFCNFLYGGLITAIVLNPPERKLGKRTSVQCTEVRFVSFLSGGFITMTILNSPEKKLAKRISLQCIDRFLEQAVVNRYSFNHEKSVIFHIHCAAYETESCFSLTLFFQYMYIEQTLIGASAFFTTMRQCDKKHFILHNSKLKN